MFAHGKLIENISENYILIICTSGLGIPTKNLSGSLRFSLIPLELIIKLPQVFKKIILDSSSNLVDSSPKWNINYFHTVWNFTEKFILNSQWFFQFRYKIFTRVRNNVRALLFHSCEPIKKKWYIENTAAHECFQE